MEGPNIPSWEHEYEQIIPEIRAKVEILGLSVYGLSEKAHQELSEKNLLGGKIWGY